MKFKILGFIILFRFVANSQVNNDKILSKIENIENDTLPFLEIINKSFSGDSMYILNVDYLRDRVKNKLDTIFIKKFLRKIIQDNPVIFKKEVIKKILLIETEYYGEELYERFVFLVKTNINNYAFKIKFDRKFDSFIYLSKKANRHYFKYAERTIRKKSNKATTSFGDIMVLREYFVNKETKAKLLIVNSNLDKRRKFIFDYFQEW